MTVASILTGGVTDTAAVVIGHAAAGAACRLLVSKDAGFTSPTIHGPTTASSHGRVRFALTGLSAGTRYWHRIEEAGTVNTAHTGTFLTDPAPAGTPASFGFAFSSCAPGTGNPPSDHPVHTRIKELADAGTVLAFMHLGDLGYPNIAVNDPDLFLANYAAQIGAPNAVNMYESTQLVYVWDDHDYGPNDSDGTSQSKTAAALAYREAIPTHPLVETAGPIYRAFTKGRVRFLVTDQRYDRSPMADPDVPGKTILGATQLAWFKAELSAAQENPDVALIVWVSSQVPHFGLPSHPNWGAYHTERTEIWDYLAANGIDKLAVISGDIHAMAYEADVDLSASQTAPVHVYVGGPLENAAGGDVDGTHNWGGWSGGGGYNVYGQYVVVHVDDPGTHVAVTVDFHNVAANGTDRVHFSHAFIKGTPPPGPGYYPIKDDGVRRHPRVDGQARMVHVS